MYEPVRFVCSVRTGAPPQTQAARPAATRPPAQSVRNQNAGGGDGYNAGGDAGRVDELTQQVCDMTFSFLSSHRVFLTALKNCLAMYRGHCYTCCNLSSNVYNLTSSTNVFLTSLMFMLNS